MEAASLREVTMNKKHYIGDGVYVDYDDFGVILTTENGIEVTNRIVLEAEVLHNLSEYLKILFDTNQLGETEINNDKP